MYIEFIFLFTYKKGALNCTYLCDLASIRTNITIEKVGK